MLVLVKTPHIEMKGNVPDKYISMLKKDFGDNNVIVRDDQKWDFAKDTDWYQKTRSRMKPKDFIRTYRESRGWTQAQLGEKLGGYSRQRISDIESGRRPVSSELAKKLSLLFKVPLENFI